MLIIPTGVVWCGGAASGHTEGELWGLVIKLDPVLMALCTGRAWWEWSSRQTPGRVLSMKCYNLGVREIA